MCRLFCRLMFSFAAKSSTITNNKQHARNTQTATDNRPQFSEQHFKILIEEIILLLFSNKFQLFTSDSCWKIKQKALQNAWQLSGRRWALARWRGRPRKGMKAYVQCTMYMWMCLNLCMCRCLCVCTLEEILTCFFDFLSARHVYKH